jgi:hypothetical protein
VVFPARRTRPRLRPHAAAASPRLHRLHLHFLSLSDY